MQLSIAQLKASILSVATNDVSIVGSIGMNSRYYLAGVCVDLSGVEPVLVSTDGHRMFVAQIGADSLTDGETLAPRDDQIVIPTKTIKTALKTVVREEYLQLAEIDRSANRYRLGLLEFTPVDGRFPDWRSVVPATLSGEPGNYNARYLLDAHKALLLATGSAATAKAIDSKPICVNQSGWNAAVVERPGFTECFVIVMPVMPGKSSALNPTDHCAWIKRRKPVAKVAYWFSY